MDEAALGFLRTLIETPSPSGYERQIQSVVQGRVAEQAEQIEIDSHGNLIAVKNPGAPLRVMLAGHCDQIGLIVQHIDDDGYLYVQPIGGWDPIMLVGQRAAVWTETAGGATGEPPAFEPVAGVIGRKPIHLLTEDERKQVPKLKDLWVDIGAKNKAEAAARVRVGDPVTLALDWRELANGRVAAPAMDDKAGLWVVAEAFRRAERGRLRCSLYVASTVQEELGLRGAKTSSFGIDPHIGIAVDVTHATDCPTVEKKEEGDIRVGQGPVIYRGPNFSPRVVERLTAAAEKHRISYQLAAAGRPPGTDANAIQLNRAGVAAGLVSIPNRYMHSPVELVSLDDLNRAADLLARFVEELPAELDLRP